MLISLSEAIESIDGYDRVCDTWQLQYQTYGLRLPSRQQHCPLASTHSHPTEGARLSWPGCLLTYQDSIAAEALGF